MKVEFHCHSEASFDCSDSLSEKSEAYLNLGFQKVYITDHDEILCNNSYGIFAPGIEVSSTFGHIILLDIKRKPYLNTLWFIVFWSKLFDSKILIPHVNRKFTGLIERHNSRGFSLLYLNWFISKAYYVEHYNHRENNKIRTEDIHSSTFNLLKNLNGVYTSDSHSLEDIYPIGTSVDLFGDVIVDVEKSNCFKDYFNLYDKAIEKSLLIRFYNCILTVRRSFLYLIYGRL